jgi:hypothetical protein
LLSLDYLKPVKNSFFDDKLKEHFSDLIYKTKTKDGKEVFIYTLIEYKSNYDKFYISLLAMFPTLSFYSRISLVLFKNIIVFLSSISDSSLLESSLIP